MQKYDFNTLLAISQVSQTTLKEIMDYLHDEPLPTDTHQRIHDALAALGTAQVIKTKAPTANHTIGIIVPGTLVDDYIGNLVSAITQTGEKLGYKLMLHTWDHDDTTGDWERFFRFTFATQQANSAFIVVIPFTYNSALLQITQEYNLPCVLIDSDLPAKDISINLDNAVSMNQVMQHLINLGHRRIGFITGQLHMASAQQRLHAYEKAMQEANLPIEKSWIRHGNWTHRSGAEEAQRLLEYAPTAIVASNDLMALGVIAALRSLGKRIPEDISVTGFDDIPMASTVSPSLTTVSQPINEMGEAAVMLVDSLLHNKQRPAQQSFIGQLIIRNSTTLPTS